MRSPDEITNVCIEANSTKKCIGVVYLVPHFFSIENVDKRPEIIEQANAFNFIPNTTATFPWSEIDMDFMNLNQAAHGDREHGFILTRLRKARKVVVGYWKEEDVQERHWGLEPRCCCMARYAGS